jgi:hypothetical protein
VRGAVACRFVGIFVRKDVLSSKKEPRNFYRFGARLEQRVSKAAKVLASFFKKRRPSLLNFSFRAPSKGCDG